MKITFQPTEAPEMGNQNKIKPGEAKAAAVNRSYGVAYGQSMDRNWIAGKKGGKEKAKTLAELQMEAGNVDAAVQQDYRTVMSNTMSAEDYARAEREGFDFSAMDPEEVVTIVDKIKAELARSGQHIAGYTDDLDQATLAAALGSETLAGAVAESFRQADIPLTEENIADVKKAWDMTSQLNVPTGAAYQYMVDNGLEPEVWNFYLSQSSGAQVSSQSGNQPKFYAEEIEGYYTETAKGEAVPNMQGEIEKLLVRENLVVSEGNYATAEELLQGGLPITKENLSLLQDLKSVEFPVTEAAFARAVATAVVEGKEPIHANLTKTTNLYERAVELLEYFQGDAEQFIDTSDITARRQLEEIRLRMTAEVNVKLIRSGFAIDTAPMEQLVEALRKVEAEVAEKYFPKDSAAVAKYELYHSTNAVVEELPGLPAQLLGPWSAEEHIGTLAQFHAEGKALQETYAKAQAGYETLMTAPRRDLGDSIRKAFANVDDILQDIGLETTEANQRAVRILGYNRMDITVANIEQVQVADEQVRAVVDKMTPASVLQMIRDGKNPLDMSFDELEQYFDSLPESYDEKVKSYSRFLYGLEQNKQITEQERESYIGIYRMLHQIEAGDGAAVGALVNVGAELHFSNLLSAVRTGKFKSMDVKVSDSLGAAVEVLRKGESISGQIAKGFVETTKNIMTQMSQENEADSVYRDMELQQLREAANVEAESVELLLRGKMSMNADNLLAAQALTEPSYNPFKEWKLKRAQMQSGKAERTVEQVLTDVPSESDDMIDGLLDALDEKESFRRHYNEMLDIVEADVQRMSLEQADNSMDVRGLQLLHKQLSVAAGMAQSEEYIFPMYVGEELTKVHLTLEQGDGEKGAVSVAIDLWEEMHLEAHLQAADGKISGFLVGNTETAVTKLQKTTDIFIASVLKGMEGDWEVDALPIVNRQENAMSHRQHASVNREVPGGKEAYKEVDNTELYRIAKMFLEAVQK